MLGCRQVTSKSLPKERSHPLLVTANGKNVNQVLKYSAMYVVDCDGQPKQGPWSLRPLKEVSDCGIWGLGSRALGLSV